MKFEALGMVEVRGFLGAIAAADTALKAANVKLLQAEVIRGGLTTVQVVGDIGAVQAAVDAAVAETSKLNCLISSHVIPRMDEATAKMLFANLTPQVEEARAPLEPEAEVASMEDQPLEDSSEQNQQLPSSEELAAMKVVDLRKLASQMDLVSLPKKEIKFANKQTLLEAIEGERERNDK